MTYLRGAASALGLAFGLLPVALTAHAAGIPEVLVSPSNQPPQCATPGRLMAFVKRRNPALRQRFEKVAVYYMKHGEALNIRWDFAFYQMLLETASLKFNGDVNWSQNNFAGLGATGNGVRGERFASVSDGVRAHLEHLLIYAGVRVDSPVADRTRKVQSWNILAPWQRSIRGPMTFGHIGTKWAPNDRGYASDIRSISNAFMAAHCSRPDPQPELFAEARGGQTQTASARVTNVRTKVQSQRQPSTRVATNSTLSTRASLGASTVYRNADANVAALPPRKKLPAGVKVLNAAPENSVPQAQQPDQAQPSVSAGARNGQSAVQSGGKKVASAAKTLASKFATPWLNPATQQNTTAGGAAGGQAKAAKPKKPKPSKCRVWTASYGGSKAIIIRSSDKSYVNYTVLDVNRGREVQEAEAYIAAYAKGGKKIGEYRSQTLAMDKAFKLCPDN